MALVNGGLVVTIANLSINGMKSHWPKVREWLHNNRPDIVTMQKVGPSENFPTRALREIGYESRCLGKKSGSDHGDRGVAILCRCTLPKPQTSVCRLSGSDQSESRFLTVNIGRLWVSSIYAPYKEGLPPKQAIARRVEWLKRLRTHVEDNGYDRRDSVLCGDFNVKVKSDGPPTGDCYSEQDQDALEELLSDTYCDLYRVVYPNSIEYPGFTFGFNWKPEGTSRLHLILASKSLAKHLRDAWVDVNARPRNESAPLVVELEDIRV